MQLRFILALGVLSLGSGTTSWAQPFPQTKFTVLNTSHGLVNDNVSCITGDNSGNVYYTTGYQNFADLGNVAGGGISVWDHRHFTNLTTASGLPSNTVQACTFDSAANAVWFGTANGVSRYSPVSGSFTNFLAGAVVRDLRVDTSGGIWVATFNQGFYRLDKSNGSVTASWNTGNGLSSNAGTSVAVEPSGVVWLGTQGGGLYRLAPPASPVRVTFGSDSSTIWDVELDASLNLWIAVPYQGLWRRTSGGSFSLFSSSSSPPAGNSANFFYSIYRDQGDNLWFSLAFNGEAQTPKVAATYLPAAQVNSATPQFQNFNAANNQFPRNILMSFWSENASTIYFGAPGGGTIRMGGPADAPGWPQPLPGYVYYSSPVLADLDGNGDLEVIVGDVSGRISVFRPNGTLMWFYDAVNAVPAGKNPGMMSIQSSPAVADVDGDGDPEVVVGLNGLRLPNRTPGYGGVIVLSKAGVLKRAMFTTDLYGLFENQPPDGFPEGVFSTPVLANVDDDPEPEIIVGALDNRFYGWNGDGTPIYDAVNTAPGDPTPTVWPFFVNDSIVSSAVVGDLNGNGVPAIVFGQDFSGGRDYRSGNTFNRGGILHVIGLQGDNFPGFPKGNLEQTLGSSPVLVDLDNDGYLEIIHGSGGDLSTVGDTPQEQLIGQLVYAWRKDGNAFGPNPTGKLASTQGRSIGAFAVGDLDNDGVPELVIATASLRNKNGQLIDAAGNPTDDTGAVGQMVYAFRTDGSLVPGFPVRPHPRIPGANLIGSVTLADVNGDGFLDIVVPVAGGLVVLDRTGKGISGMGMFGNLQDPADKNEATVTPAVADIDLDGRLEVVYTMGSGDGSTGIVRVLKLGPVNSTVQRSWPMWRRVPQRNAIFALGFGQVETTESGSNLIIRAQVFAGRTAITSVNANLASAGMGTPSLNDNGTGGDQRASDGYFTATVPLSAPFGRFRFSVTATDAGGHSAVHTFYYVRRSGAKLLSAEPASIDFGNPAANETSVRQLNVMNTSTINVTITAVSSSNAQFHLMSGESFPRTLAPGEVAMIKVGFTPDGSSGARSATLTVQSDDATNPSRVISVTGTSAGGTICTASLSPNPISSAEDGKTGTVTLNIAAGCSWTATWNVSWAQVFPMSGTGPATLNYTVFPNFSPRSRTGSVTIRGVTLNFSQSAGTGTADVRFVRLLYFNYFGRLPSAAEVDFQISQALNKGTPRGNLARDFFNSLEFNAGGRFIAGLYVGLLNRDAEYSGWLFQRNALSQNVVTQNVLVNNFISSAEYIQKFGTPDNNGYVTLLYRYVLLREPTPDEVAFQAGALAGGMTRVQLASNFLNSQEFRIGTGPRLTAFLVVATLLQRDPTPQEMQNYAARVAANTPVVDLLTELVNGGEFGSALN